MAEDKAIAGAVILFIAAAFLTLAGLEVIGAINLTGGQSYLFYRWIIYFFQFKWVEAIGYAIQFFSYDVQMGIMMLLSIVGFVFIFVSLVLFIVGAGMALGDAEGHAGMVGAIFFAIAVGLNIFSFLYGATATYDPFGFINVPKGILQLIDTTAIITIVLGFVGAGLIENAETGWK